MLGDPTRMHILLSPSWYSNLRSVGGGSFFRDQAMALTEKGHKVGVLAPRVWGVRDYRSGPLPTMNEIVAEDDGPLRVYRRNSLHRLPRLPFRDSLAYTTSGWKLFEAYQAAEGPPDLLHAHGALYGGVLARAIGRRTGIPFVITEHSADFGRAKHRWWQKWLIRQVLESAGTRLAVSPALADIISTQYPASAPPVDVVPNLLTPAFEAPLPDQPATSVDEDEAPFVLLCVARISAEKNQEGLVRAFAEAFSETTSSSGGKHPKLHFIGSGDGVPLLNLAERLGVAEHVRFLGPMDPDQVRTHMASAGCLVLASLVETFGVVIIESLAVGTPVISTASGGPDGIVTPENGILVEAGDHGALVTAMRTMVAGSTRYDATKLRGDCLSLYGRTAVVGRLTEIYAKLLTDGLGGTDGQPNGRIS